MKTYLHIIILLLSNQLLSQNLFYEKFYDPAKSKIHEFNLEFNDTLNNYTTLPIIIVKGGNSGKVFTITAGVHGSELAPIIATQKLIAEIKPLELNGTLIILPITNIGAFYGYSPYINPLDEKNINRIFPGIKDGTVSEKIAHFIANKIIPLSDIFLDVHSGDLNEDLLPFVCYYENKNYPKQTKLAKELSEYSGFENVISYPYTISNDEPAKYVFKQASQSGKIALSFESGKLGYVQKESVDRIKRGYYRIFNKLGMYKYKDPKGNTKFQILNSPIYLKSNNRGILYTKLNVGDKIIKGQKLGYMTNEFARKIEDFYSPVSGIILYMLGVPATNINQTVFAISPK